jgi:hypothetical protein
MDQAGKRIERNKNKPFIRLFHPAINIGLIAAIFLMAVEYDFKHTMPNIHKHAEGTLLEEYYLYFSSKPLRQLGTFKDDKWKDTSRWIMDTIPPGKTIWIDTGKRKFYFLTKGRYHFKLYSNYFCASSKPCKIKPHGPPAGAKTGAESENPLNVTFLWVKGENFDLSDTAIQNRPLYAFADVLFLNRMVQADVHTIIVSRKQGFLARMLDRHPHFRILFQDQRERFRAYQRGKQPPQTIENFPLHVGRKTPEFIQTLKKKHPSAYQRTVHGFLVECLGLSEERLDDVISGRLPAFRIRNFQ